MSLKGKKILIVSPHPDDEVIGFGGLIDRAKKEGANTQVLYMAVGTCRQLVTGSTNENIRMQEANAAAEYGRFKHHFVFVGDQFMHLDSLPQKELIDPIEDALTEFKPDIVGIPMHNSYDQDHRAVYSACITALRPVPRSVRPMSSFVLEGEEPYSWANDDESFKPNVYLELEEKGVKEKIELMKRHATQHREDPHPRSGENLRRLAEMRGKEIGTHAAEAYLLKRGIWS